MQNLIFFILLFSLQPDTFILCYLHQNVKIVISYLSQDGFSQNMAAITQHAIVEKRAGEGMIFAFFFPLFMFWLEIEAHDDCPTCVMRCRINCQKVGFHRWGL